MLLFEFAVFYAPEEKSTTGKAEILVQPTSVLAKDAAAVQLMAARKIPDRFESELHNVKILVRPF